MIKQARCANPNCLNNTLGTKAWYCKRCDVAGCEACYGLLQMRAKDFPDNLRWQLPDYVEKTTPRYDNQWFLVCKEGHCLGEVEIAYRVIDPFYGT